MTDLCLCAGCAMSLLQRFRSRRLRELEAKNGGAISHDDAQKQQEKQLRLRLRQKEEALAKLERAGNNDDGEKEEEVDMPIEAYTGCVGRRQCARCPHIVLGPCLIFCARRVSIRVYLQPAQVPAGN